MVGWDGFENESSLDRTASTKVKILFRYDIGWYLVPIGVVMHFIFSLVISYYTQRFYYFTKCFCDELIYYYLLDRQ
jgi:hypothetical protein